MVMQDISIAHFWQSRLMRWAHIIFIQFEYLDPHLIYKSILTCLDLQEANSINWGWVRNTNH